MTEHENALMIPLYGLFYIDDVAAFSGLSEQTLAKWKETYSAAEMGSILDAIRWAIAHPNYDFCSILNGIKHPNEDIYLFFCTLAKSFSAIHDHSTAGFQQK